MATSELDFPTHYNTLKVAKNAPPEIIKAAYKTLTQKHHPDKNPGDKNAARNMQLINEAYEVLSDPVRRAQHDAWIEAEQERRMRAHFAKLHAQQAHAQPEPSQDPQPPSRPPRPKKLLSRLQKALFLLVGVAYGLRAIGVFDVNQSPPTQQPIPPAPSTTASPPSLATSTRPPAATPGIQNVKPRLCVPMPANPQGTPWPTAAGYVKGERILAANGLSMLTIDNIKSSTSIYVKLKQLGSGITVRHVYVPAGRTFTLYKLEPGHYRVTYKDVRGGCNFKTEVFKLVEDRSYSEPAYSNLAIRILDEPDEKRRNDGVIEGEF
ncbi:DnaJ domain-containing protein [Pseudomonas sp. LS1212]|uniref:J domain-containing protein n=1 Tax=Pseudomonas sp. LS1212 TaxID=2972478 RepID=UPI00215BE761|nr:J domain-containing protein [Pseudomonas sp. LS1212]UVJ45571.1 DnaJ domain-containing protein [Pseudomonas sp. LS1212]